MAWLAMLGVLVEGNQSNEGGQLVDNAHTPLSINSDQDDWMEIYLKGQKIGYSLSRIRDMGQGYAVQEETRIRINLMGLPNDIHTVTHCLFDQEFLLKNFRFSMTSGLITYKVSGSVEGEWIHLETGDGESKAERTIRCSAPPTMSSVVGHFFKGRKIREGDSFRLSLFDPSTVSQIQAVFTVLNRETIEIDQMKYLAHRVESDVFGQKLTLWIDAKGTPLKEEGFMGLSLIRSNAAKAPLGVSIEGGRDFYELTAIRVNKRIEDADRLTYLKLRAEGFEDTPIDLDILNGGRQCYSNGFIEITRESMPEDRRHGHEPTFEEELKTFLQPEFAIESDKEPIIHQARRVVGDATRGVEMARNLTEWVYREVEKRPVVSVPSALEVLKNRVGDCNEHAVLLTALLRASGIPARVCVGLTYGKGKFFYHAWTEGFMGSWISMDATLNQMPVDATHVKIAHGGLDRQAEIIALIGRLRLEIIDYGYD